MINFRLLIFLQIAICTTIFGNEPMINHEKEAHALTKKVGEKIEKKYGIVPIGFGGAIKDKVKKLALSVQCNSKLTIATARPIVVDSVNEYLEIVNSDIQIRPYLECYPFTSTNVEINVFIEPEQEGEDQFGELVVVSASKGKIRYKVLKGKYRHETVLEESFEEAERIIKQSKND